jgi:hypothetical protein
MSRLLKSVVVVVMGLAVAGTARADSHHGQSSHGSSYTPSSSKSTSYKDSHKGTHDKDYHKSTYDKDYHKKFGTSFKYGYFYKGKSHRHWTSCYWSKSYGCTIYWCPCTCEWYYWCQPYDCYYPVSYCPTGCYSYDE